MSADTLVKVENVSKKFCRSLKKSLWYGMQDLGNELLGRRHGGDGELRPDEFWAVKDVSFELKRGECLGLIGRNGAGKTTLLRMLNGLIKPDVGRIEMRGRVGALIALGAGFNPILTGRENIYVNAAVLGLSKWEIGEKINEIIDFAEIGDFIDSAVQSYSSGMIVRLGFSLATVLEPDILILDEVLAVGDIHFRKKCYSAIGKLRKKCSTIIVSHDLSHLSQICNFGIVLGAKDFSPEILKINESLDKYTSTIYQSNKCVFNYSSFSSIENIFLFPSKIYLEWGQNLYVRATVQSKYYGHYNLRFFVRDQSEYIVAEWNSFCRFKPIEFLPGKTNLGFSWKDMKLAPGNYSIELIIYGLDGLQIAASVNINNYICVKGSINGPAKIALGYPVINYFIQENYDYKNKR